MVPTAVAATDEEGDHMAHTSGVRETVASLRPIDDLMFRVMARDLAFCRELLRVLLQDPGLEVVKLSLIHISEPTRP